MSEWISVKERLPEEGVAVLIAYDADGRLLRRIAQQYYGVWYVFGAVVTADFNQKVTHWMPLPEAPSGR